MERQNDEQANFAQGRNRNPSQPVQQTQRAQDDVDGEVRGERPIKIRQHGKTIPHPGNTENASTQTQHRNSSQAVSSLQSPNSTQAEASLRSTHPNASLPSKQPGTSVPSSKPETSLPSTQPSVALSSSQLRESTTSIQSGATQGSQDNAGSTQPLPSSSPPVSEPVPSVVAISQSNQPPVSEPVRGNENEGRAHGSLGTERISASEGTDALRIRSSIGGPEAIIMEGHSDNTVPCFKCGEQLDRDNLEDMRRHMRCQPAYAIPRPDYPENIEPSRRTQDSPSQTFSIGYGGYRNE